MYVRHYYVLLALQTWNLPARASLVAPKDSYVRRCIYAPQYAVCSASMHMRQEAMILMLRPLLLCSHSSLPSSRPAQQPQSSSRFSSLPHPQPPQQLSGHPRLRLDYQTPTKPCMEPSRATQRQRHELSCGTWTSNHIDILLSLWLAT